MSSFRDKYIKSEQPDEPKDLKKTIKETAGPYHAAMTPKKPHHENYPNSEIRQEILQRVYLLSRELPGHVSGIVTGCINTIAAVYGNDVAEEAAGGISNMLGIKMGSSEGNTLEEAMNAIKTKGPGHAMLGKFNGEPGGTEPVKPLMIGNVPVGQDMTNWLANTSYDKTRLN